MYSTIGVYKVNVRLIDWKGMINEVTIRDIVIYDPPTGIVIGWVWINILPKAYIPDPTLSATENMSVLYSLQ